MLSKLAHLSLFVALSIHAQSKPGGGIIEPEKDQLEKETETFAKVTTILNIVKQNMGMCNSVEKPLSTMKDLYAYLSDIQSKRAVEVVAGASEGVQTDDLQCEKPKFALISAEVSCLLSGVEESMNSFASNKASAKYLQKTLGVKEAEATSMLNFINYVNGPGYATKQEQKKKKMEDIEKEKGDI